MKATKNTNIADHWMNH